MGARIRWNDLPPHLKVKFQGELRSKYGAKATIVDGIRFQSKKEAKRYGELKLAERAGEIVLFRRQVPFGCFKGSAKVFTYFADFCYLDLRTCRYVVEDVKSPPTRRRETYRLKKRWLASEGINITEV